MQIDLTENFTDKDIKTTQLRKFFAAVKDIERDTKGVWSSNANVRFQLLMPKLAYAKSRSLISQPFYDLLKVSMERVKNGEDFAKFTLFLEAIVAFYKANVRGAT